MLLKNKKVVLTGAAGGIGSVITKKFVKEGAYIALLDVTQEPLEQLKSEIQSDRVCAFVTDISQEYQVETTMLEIELKFGRIDVLINNAGIQAPIGHFINNDLSLWRKNIAVNLFGAVHCTSYALRSMVKNRKGKIVNLSGGGSTSPRQKLLL
jgi:NAD(P)-dependent dehydrogenase (short-subunit alcohol dehydrogenase family)